MIRQYLNKLYTWSDKKSRICGSNLYCEAMKGAFIMRPVFCCNDSDEAKLKQIRKLLWRAKTEEQKGRFFYSLDENICLCNKNRTRDNMPVDYSVIVDYGLNERAGEAFAAMLAEYIDFIGDERLQPMKTGKAESLFDALQRILFYNQILWQTGHALNGLGRLDKVLERFEPDEDLLKGFLSVLHSHYNFKSSEHLGDTGQIIILGGTEPDGIYFCNEYTEMIVKCLREMHVPDPKCLLRVNSKTPGYLLEAAVDCIATGIGSPLLSNDDVVIPALEAFGYSHDDACNYGVSACWEPLSIGCSFEQNNLADIEYARVFCDTVRDDRFPRCGNFDGLKELCTEHQINHIDGVLSRLNEIEWEKDPVLDYMFPSGLRYNNYGVLSVGLSSAVDSLLNIRKYVFDEKKFTLYEVADALNSNYSGFEEMKNLFLKNDEGFGSTDAEAVSLTRDIMGITADCLKEYKNPLGGGVKAGLCSPTYIRLGKATPATADGRLSGHPLKEHISGAGDSVMTDIMLFAGKLDYSGVSANGNVVDIILPSALLQGNREKFVSYLRACFELGIFQTQFNVISLDELLDAKEHPENHRDLIVRVWGFSAYFTDLPEDYQNTLIERAKELESA